MGRRLKIGLGVGLVGVGIAAAALYRPLEVAASYSAKRLCSEVFVAGRQEPSIVAEDLALMPVPLLTSVDRTARTASVNALGVRRTAAWRPGLGCALAIGESVEGLQALRANPGPRPERGAGPWPEGEGPVDPSRVDPRIDRQAMEAAVAAAFDEPDPDNLRRTRAVVVVYRGQLVAERYAEGFNKDTPLLGWSMTKSATNAVIGALVFQGRLDIHKPAPVPEWASDERAAITTDMLLRMSSGLDFDEGYGPYGGATAMLFARHDAAAEGADHGLAHAPDEAWSYSSGTTNILSRIARHTIGDDAVYLAYPRVAIFDPIGATSAVMETDPSGTFVGSSFLYMTARDWARFGLLFARDGVWQGRRLLPEGWAAAACTPTPKAPQGQYGAQWWTNAGDPPGSANRPYPSLPVDTCSAQGFETQRIMIIPSLDLIVVRLGLTRNSGDFDVDRFVAAIIGAIGPVPSEPESQKSR